MKNRKELKKKKAAKIKNKKLIKKYPWLKPYNAWTGKYDKDYDYSYTWYDDIPAGWRKCFGSMLLEELDIASKGHIHFQQIKEKWGELCIYASTTKEAHEVIDKYAAISRNVCIDCGQPDVPMLYTGWQSPWCEKCFKKAKYYGNRNYMDFIDEDEDPRMTDSIKYSTFGYDVNGEVVAIPHVTNISDTVNKIRARYHLS